VKTTTITGYLRLWLLARLRWLRPISYRAHEEHRRMEDWLAAVRRCAGSSAQLGREVARAAQLVKGYGDVRRRMMRVLDDLLARVLEAVELEAEPSATTALAARYRALALTGPDGEAEAATLAREVVDRLRRGERASALELVG
jgi:indolepyruvate ferredoxin oxidoreductase beta subunit